MRCPWINCGRFPRQSPQLPLNFLPELRRIVPWQTWQTYYRLSSFHIPYYLFFTSQQPSLCFHGSTPWNDFFLFFLSFSTVPGSCLKPDTFSYFIFTVAGLFLSGWLWANMHWCLLLCLYQNQYKDYHLHFYRWEKRRNKIVNLKWITLTQSPLS